MKIGPFEFSSGFWLSKTTWTVLGGVGYLIVQGVTHQLPWNGVVSGILAALVALGHNDTVRKAAEVEAGQRAQMMSLAINGPAKVNLTDAMTAHAQANKAGIAAAVAATVTAVLDRYAAEYNAPAAETVTDGAAMSELKDGEADA